MEPFSTAAVRGASVALLLAMLSACGDGQSDALKSLSDKGYSLSVAEFHRAAAAGDTETLGLFLQAGTGINVASPSRRTALIEAAEAGKSDAVEWLIRHGADLKARDSAGGGTVVAAVKGGNARVLTTMTDAGAELLPSDRPLTLAASYGHLEIVQVLLPRCADEVQSALFAASKAGAFGVAEALLRAGGSVFAAEPDSGRTALMLAAAGGHAEMVDFLMRSGSNRLALDGQGQTALELAAAGGHDQIVAALSAQLRSDEMEHGLLQGGRPEGGLREVSAGAATAEAVPEGQLRSLSSLAKEIGMADTGHDVMLKLRLRSVREEMHPWILETSADGPPAIRNLIDGRAVAVAMAGKIGGGPWSVISRTPGDDASLPRWMRGGLRVEDPINHLSRLLLPKVPLRAGVVCATFQVEGRPSTYEARVGDQVFASGALETPWVVESINTVAAVVTKKTGERLVVDHQGTRKAD